MLVAMRARCGGSLLSSVPRPAIYELSASQLGGATAMMLSRLAAFRIFRSNDETAEFVCLAVARQ